MKSRNQNSPVKDVEIMEQANPVLEYITQEEESDGIGALLRRVADRGNYKTASFAYPEEVEMDDYVDEDALHRVVEDLQFGHDLRM